MPSPGRDASARAQGRLGGQGLYRLGPRVALELIGRFSTVEINPYILGFDVAEGRAVPRDDVVRSCPGGTLVCRSFASCTPDSVLYESAGRATGWLSRDSGVFPYWDG